MRYLVLGLGWLLLSLPFAVVVGSCIAAGQRHLAAELTAVAGGPSTVGASGGHPVDEAPAVPAQRQPVATSVGGTVDGADRLLGSRP